MPRNNNSNGWDEFTDDGQEMWDRINNDDEFVKNPISDKKKKLSKKEFNLRIELKKLQKNSEIVVKECKESMERYVKKEQYFKANEARVAGMIHQNFIDRLQLILDGSAVFTNITLTDDEISKLLD